MDLIYQLDSPTWHIPSLAECVEYFVRKGDTEQAGREFWQRHQDARWRTRNGKWVPYLIRADETIEAHRVARCTQAAQAAQRAHATDLARPSPIPAIRRLYRNTAPFPQIPPSVIACILDILDRPTAYAFNVRVKAVLTIELLPAFFDHSTQASAVELRQTLQQNPSEYARFVKILTPVIASQYGGQP